MDTTAVARKLLEPIPAHRTAGIEVVSAADGAAKITAHTPEALTNVIGSLHSSGLIALIDAVGLAAIIADSPPSAMTGVLPLGRAASVQFLAPARGRLTATCALTDDARNALRPLWLGHSDRVRLSTHAQISDDNETLVCEGSFEWSLRRVSSTDEPTNEAR